MSRGDGDRVEQVRPRGGYGVENGPALGHRSGGGRLEGKGVRGQATSEDKTRCWETEETMSSCRERRQRGKDSGDACGRGTQASARRGGGGEGEERKVGPSSGKKKGKSQTRLDSEAPNCRKGPKTQEQAGAMERNEGPTRAQGRIHTDGPKSERASANRPGRVGVSE